MLGGIANFALRGFQFLFGIVVLGLSVTLIKNHHWGGLPATLGLSAVVGGIAILGAFIGLAATWVDMLGGMIGLAVDGFVLVVNAIGGIVMSIGLKGVKCKAQESEDNAWKLINNDMLNGGCLGKNKPSTCYGDADSILSNCKMAQADAVFMFLTVVLVAVCGLLTFLRAKKGY